MPHKDEEVRRAYQRRYRERYRKAKSDPQRRAAQARARNQALQRLADEHPIEYRRYLAEERLREGIPYVRKQPPRYKRGR